MPRQTYYAYIQAEILSAELGTDIKIPGHFQQPVFKLQIPKGMAVFISPGWQTVKVPGRSQLDGFEVELGRSPADHKCQMIGRAGCCAQCFHLALHIIQQFIRRQNSFGFLIQKGLVRRSAAFGQEQEVISAAFDRIQLDLGRQVAAGIPFFKHGQGGILRIPQIGISISIKHPLRKGGFIRITGPNLLTLFAHNNSCSGILTHGKDTFGCDYGIFQQFQGYISVIGRAFRIFEDISQQLQM